MFPPTPLLRADVARLDVLGSMALRCPAPSSFLASRYRVGLVHVATDEGLGSLRGKAPTPS